MRDNYKVILASDQWFTSMNWSVRGYAYLPNGEMLKDDAFCRYLAQSSDVVAAIGRLNGLFAIVHQIADNVLAAIDPSRIYPLYYRMKEDNLVIADNPYLLLENGDTLDASAVNEYNASGAPFEGKTLIKDIMQVKPSSCLMEDFSTRTMYSFLSTKEELFTPTLADFDDTLIAVFQRLIQSINNRQIVVPLSGGKDSRLIVTMLHRLKYQNVICYTVCQANNEENVRATRVAQQLGYTHYNISISQSDWKDLIQPSNLFFQRYVQHIGFLGNFVWLFELPAILYLQQNHLIASDAVFIPGHAADWNAGSHLTRIIAHPKDSIHYLTSAIVFDSFEYSTKKVWSHVKNDLRNHMHSSVNTWSVYQSFVGRNRIPHQINNSSRIYEFFNYDVRLPFWDKEFMEVFRRLPLKELQNCHFYSLYTKALFEKYGIWFTDHVHSNWFYWYRKLRLRIKSILPHEIGRHFIHIQDTLGEGQLIDPLLQELMDNHIYANDKCFFSINQVLKDWYLLHTHQMLQGSIKSHI